MRAHLNVNTVATATTGLAAKSIGGTTIHKFTTVGDGSLSGEEYGALLSQRPSEREAIR